MEGYKKEIEQYKDQIYRLRKKICYAEDEIKDLIAEKKKEQGHDVGFNDCSKCGKKFDNLDHKGVCTKCQ